MTSPRAAYIHVPFCRHRCGYCNFTLVANRDDLIKSYLAGLAAELQTLVTPRPVETLFIGGGTPTHLDPESLAQLLRLVRDWFPWEEGAEVSMEANPRDLDRGRVDGLASGGVNRISLGVQSWQDAKLSQLERDHNAETIAAALSLVRPRFRSVSLDLIFGVPGEAREMWQDDLARTCRASIDHVSTYGLTYERGTAFWSRRQRAELQPIAEEDERWMYETAIDTLQAAGFEHYEVSNFARPGHRCRHNEVYWRGDEYFAAGPGAARYVNGRRELNHRSTTTYLKRVLAGQSPVAESETLAAEDRARERLVFGLRQLAGVQAEQFAQLTGFRIRDLAEPHLTRFCQHGLLQWTDNRLQLTRAGLLISDSIWPYLL